MKTRFEQILDEQFEAFKGVSIPGTRAVELSGFEANPEPGRTLMHLHTNRKLGSDYYWQLKAYGDILARRSTQRCALFSTNVQQT